MELDFLNSDMALVVDKFLTEINELSIDDLNELKNSPNELDRFIDKHLDCYIMVNDLKRGFIPEFDFFIRRAFLKRVETFLIIIFSRKCSGYIDDL